MSYRLISLVLAVLLIGAAAAVAQEENLSQTYYDCMEKSGGVTQNMLNCIHAETERQDDRLNAVYKKLMANLRKAQQERLKKAQRLWIQYRDANVEFYGDPEGGTLARVTAASTFLQMTADRADELEAAIQE